MAAITKIVHNLLLLYGQKPPQHLEQRISRQVPDNVQADAIAFFLHQSGISTIRLYIHKADIASLHHPFLVLRTTPAGDTEALHIKEGIAHQLTPTLLQETDIDNWIREDAMTEILAFDGDAFSKATLPPPAPVNKSYPALVTGGILVLMAVIAGWVMRVTTMPFINQVLAFASLLTAFVSLVLLLKETGIAGKYTRPFCGKVNYLGCSLLITSPLAKNKWGLSWAALGLTHALTSLLYILFANPTPAQQLMYLLLWLLPAAGMMVYLLCKMWKLRTYCKLCILVHAINLLSFSIAAVLFTKNQGEYTSFLTINHFLVFAGTALLSGWLVLALYQLLKQVNKLNAANTQITDLSYSLLQNNPAADEAVLHQLLDTYQPLALNTAAKDEEMPSLLLVVSLHCSHCARLMQAFSNGHITDQWLTGILVVADAVTPAAGTQLLLDRLQQQQNTPEERITLLKQWYTAQEFIEKEEAAFDLQSYPFCIHAAHNPIEHLPAVFIAGKRMPYPLGSELFVLALFIRSRQLEAMETETA